MSTSKLPLPAIDDSAHQPSNLMNINEPPHVPISSGGTVIRVDLFYFDNEKCYVMSG